jgi:hypothetical protein
LYSVLVEIQRGRRRCRRWMNEFELYLRTAERESVRCVWSEVNSNFSTLHSEGEPKMVGARASGNQRHFSLQPRNYFRQRGVSAPNLPLGCGNTTAKIWPRESTRVLKVDRDDDVADIAGMKSSEMNAGKRSSAVGSTQCPFQPSRVRGCNL